MSDIGRMFQRRARFIKHNNYAIMQTTIFYENFLSYDIIIPYFIKRHRPSSASITMSYRLKHRTTAIQIWTANWNLSVS